MDPTFLSFALRENEFFAGTRTGKYKTNQQMRKNRFSTPKQDLYRFNQERSSVRLCSPLRSWTIFCKLQIHCPSQKPSTAISSSSRFDTKSMQCTMNTRPKSWFINESIPPNAPKHFPPLPHKRQHPRTIETWFPWLILNITSTRTTDLLLQLLLRNFRHFRGFFRW